MGSEDHASVHSEDRDSVDSEQQASASTVRAGSTEVPHSTGPGASIEPDIGHRAGSIGPAFTGPALCDPGLASGEQATTGRHTRIIVRGTTAVPTIVRGTITDRPTLTIARASIVRGFMHRATMASAGTMRRAGTTADTGHRGASIARASMHRAGTTLHVDTTAGTTLRGATTPHAGLTVDTTHHGASIAPARTAATSGLRAGFIGRVRSVGSTKLHVGVSG